MPCGFGTGVTGMVAPRKDVDIERLRNPNIVGKTGLAILDKWAKLQYVSSRCELSNALLGIETYPLASILEFPPSAFMQGLSSSDDPKPSSRSVTHWIKEVDSNFKTLLVP